MKIKTLKSEYSMKKSILLNYLIVLISLILLTSCEKEDSYPDNNDNSNPVIIDSPIEDNRILEDINQDENAIDYLIDTLLLVNAKLEIKPGVVIAFSQNCGIKVQNGGSIIAKGSKDNPILFRGEEKYTGYWSGIFWGNQDIISELKYCNFMHAGSGAHFEDKAVIIMGDSLMNPYFNSQIYLLCSNVTIDESQGYGMIISLFSSVALDSIKINVDFRAAMKIPLNYWGYLGPSIELNSTSDHLIEYGNSIILGQDYHWEKNVDGTPYYISGFITFWGRFNLFGNLDKLSKISFEKGVELRFNSGGIIINEGATIEAIGSEEEPIILTAIDESSSWSGIVIHSNSFGNKLNYCNISKAGLETNVVSEKGNIILSEVENMNGIFPAYLSLKNSKITDSKGCGVFVSPGAMLIDSSNFFSGNSLGDICN